MSKAAANTNPFTRSAAFAFFDRQFSQDPKMTGYVDGDNMLNLTGLSEDFLNSVDGDYSREDEAPVYEFAFDWYSQPKIKRLFNE